MGVSRVFVNTSLRSRVYSRAILSRLEKHATARSIIFELGPEVH